MANKNKASYTEFKQDIYPVRIWISDSTATEYDGFDTLFEFDNESDAMVQWAYNKKEKTGGIFIRFRSRSSMTTDIIAHESAHAAMEIASYIGGIVDLQNQEWFSYLVGYIAACCDKVRKLSYCKTNKKQTK